MSADAITAARAQASFTSIDDLKQRVPLSKHELRALAELGALNEVGKGRRHRRDALWQAELALHPAGELLAEASPAEIDSPLRPMNPVERLQADFVNSSLSIGAHPIRFHRPYLNSMKVFSAAQLISLPDGMRVQVAGTVICRQQPGTAKGFVFLSLEDETGVANIIVRPTVFQKFRAVILESAFALVEGVLQNTRGVCSVRALRIRQYEGISSTAAVSHDFR